MFNAWLLVPFMFFQELDSVNITISYLHKQNITDTLGHVLYYCFIQDSTITIHAASSWKNISEREPIPSLWQQSLEGMSMHVV